MTRKDYALIAEAIATSSLNANSATTIAVQIADALASENDKFDYDKFYEACCVDPTDPTWER